MAFQSNTARAPKEQNDSWKAQGFLNLYLPSKNGDRRKLGAIPLKDAKPAEQSLRAWLEADEKNIQTLINKLEVEYQPATPAEGSGFDLG